MGWRGVSNRRGGGRWLRAWPALVLVAALGGCSGDPDNGPAETVEEALANLDIDTTPTPRLDEGGEPLPDSYAPFGASAAVRPFSEIAMLGFQLGADTSRLSIVKQNPGTNNSLTSETLHSVPSSETPWLSSTAVHASAGGDFDGDGIGEIAIVYYEDGAAFVYMVVVQDEAQSFVMSDPLVVSDVSSPTSLSLEAGDFDGDGLHEVALGITTAAGGQVAFTRQGTGGLELTGKSVSLTPELLDADHHMGLATGNVDYDPGHELVAILNEKKHSEGRANFILVDDADQDHQTLTSGRVRAEVGVQVYTAAVGDVSFGNLDDDPLDEIVLGGLTEISGNTTSIKEWGHLVYVIDDAKRAHEVVASTHFTPRWQGITDSGQSLTLDYMHVNTLDLDGDRIDEIQANQFIFDDLVNAAPFTEIHTIPSGEIIWGSGDGSRQYTVHDSAVVVGDVNSDRREDIVFVSEAQPEVRMWALDTVNGFSKIQELPANVSSAPNLIAVNVDDDSVALDYSEGSYELVFTEPVVLAALAAAPCNPSWGQDANACQTAYGKAKSTTISLEESTTVSASSTVGFSASFSALGVEVGSAEMLATLTQEATRSQGRSYSLTQRVEHTTGPIEDAVLFTTIPLDRYTYEVLSHPNPKLIGSEVVVSLPREPITVLTRRSFYNEAITEDALPIDDRVFTHVPGDPTSYPSPGEKASLLSSYEGLESPEVDVGEGGGRVSVGVSVYEEITTGQSYSWNATLDIKTTSGGVVQGASVGYGQEKTIGVGIGRETSYTGTVSNLDAASFTEQGYGFGLFSYVYTVPGGQQFEVLNYWVR